jgi:hypothetical protein
MQNYDGWYVQVLIPGVPPIALGGFKTEEEVAEWVRWKSKMWLDEHRGQYFYASPPSLLWTFKQSEPVLHRQIQAVHFVFGEQTTVGDRPAQIVEGKHHPP